MLKGESENTKTVNLLLLKERNIKTTLTSMASRIYRFSFDNLAVSLRQQPRVRKLKCLLPKPPDKGGVIGKLRTTST